MCDQFVDRTSGRADTFYDGPIVSHVSSAEIYDPELRRIAIEVIREHGIPVHERGTVVVIQGPRFSTKSESKWFSDAGWEVINMTQYPEAYLCRELGMAVVNISLITDYDAGVHEGTEAVNAMSVLEVFELNAARIQKVVLEMIRRFPADLDALGAGDMLQFTRGDGHTIVARGHPAVRDRALRWPVARESARPAADRGLDPDDPGDARTGGSTAPAGSTRRATPGSGPGTTSSARATGRCRSSSAGRSSRAAAATTRGVTVGSFVVNVMNRHPAVLARMATTLQTVSGGRLVLGIGIGGHPAEHRALGIPFPDAPERVARMEEAIAVLRALWTGGPVTRPSPFYPLEDAVVSAGPIPAAADRHRRRDAAPGRGSRPGSATAGRAFERQFEAHLPAYLEALEASRAGRAPTSRPRRLRGLATG